MRVLATILVLVGMILVATPRTASAHCDTMDGPVVVDARVALEKGDITPVLRWIHADAEAELRAAFDLALRVRGLNKDARDLADRSFFETLVRVHRAGEGAPYTGVKPAGTELPHFVVAADKALAGEIPPDTLVKHLSKVIAEGIEIRYAKAAEIGRAHV